MKEIDIKIKTNEEEAEYDVMKERKPVVKENIYLTRGLRNKPSLDDKTRGSQMCCCAKLSTFDWTEALTNDNIFSTEQEIIEVRFKNSRKEFFVIDRTKIKDEVKVGDIIVVDAENGYDIGLLSLKGMLAKMQYNKAEKVKPVNELKKVIRKANQLDVDRWDKSINLEQTTFVRSRIIASKLGLQMKINDVEYQGDGTKATFFYTADDRIDFRQLIKDYAAEFKIKIEMRQIGSRQESMHLGGIGVCGRELCCVSYLSNFHSVSTQTAKVQQMSLNTQKLAGQCGKLKCCINYEFEVYQEAIKDFPDTDTHLYLRKGEAIWKKTDVFSRILYYAYTSNKNDLIGISVDSANEIISKNNRKEYPDSLEHYAIITNAVTDVEENVEYSKIEHKDDITRFDRKQNGSQNRNNPHSRNNSQNRNYQHSNNNSQNRNSQHSRNNSQNRDNSQNPNK
ncbi:hypothetical protein FACS1894153_0280 [Bacteroidia bacterium]|nr:hypothetical protein FACS1894153_0280 [Bacteroidia bacterium]